MVKREDGRQKAEDRKWRTVGRLSIDYFVEIAALGYASLAMTYLRRVNGRTVGR
jgi:uncharacterized protein YmfQ (DUF2313 family)